MAAGFAPLHQREILHSLQQPARLLFDVQFSQAMTAVMKSDLGRDPAAEFGNAQLIYQKGRKLENPLTQ